MDEIDAIFVAEAQRRLDEVARILDAPFPRPETPAFAILLRHAHSLKGTAGTLGHHEIEALAAAAWLRLDSERRTPDPRREEEVREEFAQMGDELRRLHAA